MKQTIDLGAAPNDGTGDTLRDAGGKINDNFDELYGTPSPTAITLGGGWSNTGSGLVPARFYKAPNGLVTIEGTISGGGDGDIGTLPAGSRPDTSMVFVGRNSGGVFRIDVATSGVISVVSTGAGFHSLNGVSFYAAP